MLLIPRLKFVVKWLRIWFFLRLPGLMYSRSLAHSVVTGLPDQQADMLRFHAQIFMLAEQGREPVPEVFAIDKLLVIALLAPRFRFNGKKPERTSYKTAIRASHIFARSLGGLLLKKFKPFGLPSRQISRQNARLLQCGDLNFICPFGTGISQSPFSCFRW